mgnify:CR=1 FL=1
MKQGDLLYLGKAKSVYLTDKPDELLVVFRDDITAFDGQKKNVLAGRGSTMQRLRHTSIRFLKHPDTFSCGCCSKACRPSYTYSLP